MSGDLDPAKMTWTCMVCGDERPDAAISVAYRPIAGLEDRFPVGARTNVRYCNDRPECAGLAHEGGPWTGSPLRHREHSGDGEGE